MRAQPTTCSLAACANYHSIMHNMQRGEICLGNIPGMLQTSCMQRLTFSCEWGGEEFFEYQLETGLNLVDKELLF